MAWRVINQAWRHKSMNSLMKLEIDALAQFKELFWMSKLEIYGTNELHVAPSLPRSSSLCLIVNQQREAIITRIDAQVRNDIRDTRSTCLQCGQTRFVALLRRRGWWLAGALDHLHQA
jgi:hypothetical protein